MKLLAKKSIFLLIVIIVKLIKCNETFENDENEADTTTSSSYDSLMSSQCKARCLSLYPWKLPTNSTIERRNRDMIIAQHRRIQRHNNNNNLSSMESNNHHLNVKWHKVMELCSKNTNCLQCSLPCDIPTNLLPNCKYLCKQQHPLCIESCSLLNKLNEEKHGSCPALEAKPQTDNNNNGMNKCISSPQVPQCGKDADCSDIKKCCLINQECPELGSTCKKPTITSSLNLPSIPFNLTITERKKGKTVILSWDCVYNKNKPTMFVVEGRWSLKSPTHHLVESRSVNGVKPLNDNQMMTKWGYLAQTTNNNWIILRSINRGRWYKFRVAAISKSGTFGYSQPTELFILSSPPKPPSQPQNLTAVQIYKADDNKVDVDLSWLPSKRSDLPISNYKLTWKQLNAEESTSGGALNNADADEDLDGSGEEQIINTRVVKTPEYGLDLIANANKYTVKGLNKNSIYLVELFALSKHDETSLLSSAPIRLRLDTSQFRQSNGQAAAGEFSSLLSKPGDQNNRDSKDYEDEADDDEEEEDEDDDLDEETPIKPNNQQQQQQQFIRNSPQANQVPVIKNLTIQTPYFQNGLVKAKLAWQMENLPAVDQQDQQQQSQMYTIAWFAIKCVSHKLMQDHSAAAAVTLSQKQLPTPITATTINTNFEIYELKYNCDYVVNVRLANVNKPLTPELIAQSSSLTKPLVPQIASAQFKVPACNLIKVIGRIRPTCLETRYVNNIESYLLNNDKPTPSNNIYNLLFTTSTPSITTTTTKSTFSPATLSLIKYDKNSLKQSGSLMVQQSHLSLPRVYNIKYRIIDNKDMMYSVEFTWSIPMQYLTSTSISSNFHGFQISVVPKAIPGLTSYQDNGEINSSNFGSVGAIVQKDQLSFLVRNLRSKTRYIFQIQSIGVDNQYGVPSTLEFLIEENELEQTRDRQLILRKEQRPVDYDDLVDESSSNILANIDSNGDLAEPSSDSINFYPNSSNNLKLNQTALFIILISLFVLIKFDLFLT